MVCWLQSWMGPYFTDNSGAYWMLSRYQHLRSIPDHKSYPLFSYSWQTPEPWFTKSGPHRSNISTIQELVIISILWAHSRPTNMTEILSADPKPHQALPVSQYMLTFENDQPGKQEPLLLLYDKHLRCRKGKWLPVSCRMWRRQDLNMDSITTQSKLESQCHIVHSVRNEARIIS